MEQQIKFRDPKHEEGFNDFMTRAKVNEWDKERISLFCILALFEDIRSNITTLYNFEDNCVKFEGLNKGWQTGGTVKATKLAFNLFTNFRGQKREKEDYSPLELFSVEIDYRNYMLMAVQIRFS
ncbi:DUF6075 family protein [Clostridium estertheticum]|uniref:DUF6075 family protein n=1 Tax=Clostridium estertheticum TaxID=238834 RepID=UPI001C0C674A|nr:DUF6075 family protein [Clostridium estertheticum]MBU3200308.1 hypothetical protein [Clostridium estertheticum]WAG64479.1 DUF6075 family protein [Clostridium estertheticum]